MRLISKLFNRQYFNQLAIFTMLMAVTPMAIAQQVSVSTKKTASKYLNSILPEAERIQKQYGIPLDLTLAIARQESGN
ncbi:hypothetical protein [Pleurocapsa sp. FMAR1]|uniref:hypothetical protein n=1 Tax=Pleurocapsa sp. FMAR1 TaxID=3040204 RepID=UPI0029C848D8|nr:hypothetical protein [Pleurocapsa sp. FMAR1]